jgi:hypothetical protein
VAAIRTEKERQEHASAHQHFEDHPL